MHHFESSEEVPEEEQQKCESQHKNLRGEKKGGKKVRAEGTALATFKRALMGLGWQVHGSVSTEIRGEKIVAKYTSMHPAVWVNRMSIFIMII